MKISPFNARAKFLKKILIFHENSRDLPENSLALIFTNISETSREFSGLYWNRNRLKILGNSREFPLYLLILGILGILGNSQELSKIILTLITSQDLTQS